MKGFASAGSALSALERELTAENPVPSRLRAAADMAACTSVGGHGIADRLERKIRSARELAARIDEELG